jgi:hypothetical protein
MGLIHLIHSNPCLTVMSLPVTSDSLRVAYVFKLTYKFNGGDSCCVWLSCVSWRIFCLFLCIPTHSDDSLIRFMAVQVQG